MAEINLYDVNSDPLKIIVFEEESPVGPFNGDVYLVADNGNWTIEHNSSECEQHITISSESGSSDCTVHIGCDGTPKEPGNWCLKFFLDDVFKASLDIHVYANGYVPDPPIPDEEELLDPVCGYPFNYPALIETMQGQLILITSPVVCPQCGASDYEINAKIRAALENKVWDEEQQDYYIQILNCKTKVLETIYLMSQIMMKVSQEEYAVIRNLGG